MSHEDFLIDGMHCPSCARIIEMDSKKLPGVESARVDLAAGKLCLDYDRELFDLAQLEAVIKAAGFTLRKN